MEAFVRLLFSSFLFGFLSISNIHFDNDAMQLEMVNIERKLFCCN